MKWIVSIAVVVALLVAVLLADPWRPDAGPRGSDPEPPRGVAAPAAAAAPIAVERPRIDGADRVVVSEGVAIELIGVGDSGDAVSTRIAGPAGADGRVPMLGDAQRSHRIDEPVASHDYIVFARGFLPVRIATGTRFERPVHRLVLARARTLRFLIEGDWDVTGLRVTMGMHADTRDMRPEEARIAAWSHRTVGVTQRVFEVERTGSYGGKAMFTVLDASGRPIGAGPVVEFGAEDEDVVVAWDEIERLRSISELSLQLTFDRAAPSGDLKLELSPGVLDVLRRIRFRREPETEVVQLVAESMPMGDYEVALVAAGRRAVLGKLSLNQSEQAVALHVGQPATLQVAIAPGDAGVRSIRLHDANGRLVDAWLPDGGERAEVRWQGLGPGAYWFFAVGEHSCSPPEPIELHAGEVAVRDVVLGPAGEVSFAIAGGGQRVAMARQTGRPPVMLLCVDGASCTLPVGAWQLEIDDVVHRIDVASGQTVSLTL